MKRRRKRKRKRRNQDDRLYRVTIFIYSVHTRHSHYQPSTLYSTVLRHPVKTHLALYLVVMTVVTSSYVVPYTSYTMGGDVSIA